MNKIKIYTKVYFLALIPIIFLIIGCAGQIKSPLPKLVNPSNAATIIIIRENGIKGMAWPVEFDGNTIVTLTSGEYVKFIIDPGKHYLAIGEYYLKEIIKIEVQPKQIIAYKIKWVNRPLDMYLQTVAMSTSEALQDINEGKYKLVGQ